MSHKVHPKIYRLRGLQDWNSRWLDKKKFLSYLREDFIIREELEKKLKKLSVEKIEIERFPGKVIIIIYSARPGLIIGRGGGGIEDLKKQLEKKIFKVKNGFKIDLKIDVKEIKNPWLSAALSAQWMAQQIEKRARYKKVLKWTLEKIMALKENIGARVEVAGRLDGTEIARREWLRKGNLPRQTIRANIDYAEEKAFCTYGVIGIKVWIYKGEYFD